MSGLVRVGRNAVTRNTRAIERKVGGGKGPLIWTTAEGERMPITAMATSHLFNAMKMVFNHIADVWGGEPVWFNHQYSDYTTAALTGPHRLAQVVFTMLEELDRRKDLDPKYLEPLAAIRRQVLGPAADRKKLR